MHKALLSTPAGEVIRGNIRGKVSGARHAYRALLEG